MKKIVVVALSGGVDSAIAALLMQKEYHVIGVHAVCYDKDVPHCTAKKDREDAIKVATFLDIPLKVYDLTKEYKEQVIDIFVKEYESNRTPNPDILCNQNIKFDILFKKCFEDLKFNVFATGHYAKISRDCRIQIPKDKSKDQTYFLYKIPRLNLDKVRFPLDDMTKLEVRKLAKKANLPNRNKPDSQGICFIGNISMADFLEEYIKIHKGDVIDNKGKKIGTHKGVLFYTIGQRHGFKINNYFGKALYVIKKNIDKNQLVVGTKDMLYTDIFKVDFDFINDRREYFVRIRNLGTLHKCTVKKETVEITDTTNTKIYAPAPGQSAVLYDIKTKEIVGGGIII